MKTSEKKRGYEFLLLFSYQLLNTSRRRVGIITFRVLRASPFARPASTRNLRDIFCTRSSGEVIFIFPVKEFEGLIGKGDAAWNWDSTDQGFLPLHVPCGFHNAKWGFIYRRPKKKLWHPNICHLQNDDSVDLFLLCPPHPKQIFCVNKLRERAFTTARGSFSISVRLQHHFSLLVCSPGTRNIAEDPKVCNSQYCQASYHTHIPYYLPPTTSAEPETRNILGDNTFITIDKLTL